MIKIHHPNKPQTLIDREGEWTVTLLTLVKKYGGFNKIPKKEKDGALVHYKDPKFIKDIFSLTNYKCTFCESSIDNVSDIHVEHFFPKSLYPKLAFKWTNLIPACERCNRPKDNFDTKNLPFVNPMLDNPDQFFDYSDCRIKISLGAPDPLKAKNTIDACDLKRVALTRVYSELMPTIHEISNKTEIAISQFNKLRQSAAKLKVLRSILESMENLVSMSKSGYQHASFIKSMVNKDSIFMDAVRLINLYHTDLGLVQPLRLV